MNLNSSDLVLRNRGEGMIVKFTRKPVTPERWAEVVESLSRRYLNVGDTTISVRRTDKLSRDVLADDNSDRMYLLRATDVSKEDLTGLL